MWDGGCGGGCWRLLAGCWRLLAGLPPLPSFTPTRRPLHTLVFLMRCATPCAASTSLSECLYADDAGASTISSLCSISGLRGGQGQVQVDRLDKLDSRTVGGSGGSEGFYLVHLSGCLPTTQGLRTTRRDQARQTLLCRLQHPPKRRPSCLQSRFLATNSWVILKIFRILCTVELQCLRFGRRL
jgi:hypothetical protein